MPPAKPGHTAIRILVLVLCVLALGAAAGPSGPARADQATTHPFAAQSAVDPDDVLLGVALRSDGSAAWRIEYRVRLDDENTTQAFESLQSEVEADPASFTEPFADRLGGTVAAAEQATGRSMSLRNVTVSADRRQLPQEYGVLVYRFEWIGFAAVEDSTVRAGDAVAGLFLDGETTLLVSWPSGYQVDQVTPEPHDQRERSVVWNGPLEFATGEPRIVVSQRPAIPTPTGSAADGGSEPDGEGDGAADDGLGGVVTVAAGAGVLIAILVAIGWFYRHRLGLSSRRDDTTGTAGAAEATDGPPDDLLRTDERVLALLEERGGRMKQQEVASELDWTDAKTSQVVSELRDAGAIESFRLGRENVLTLPGEDLESPSDRDEGSDARPP